MSKLCHSSDLVFACSYLASLLQPLSASPPSGSHTCRMSESVHESKPPSTPGPAEDPWRVAFDEFKKRDEKMVKDYQEEIDTLLVFVRCPHHLFIFRLITLTSQAGLFSAVLTAFVVESYQSLQEDLAQTSVDLLRHISHQLANSSFPAATDSSQFQAHRSDVRVNVCWFVSLLLALVVALFGIFLKQWMRTYMKWTDVTPDQDAVALRQFRYRSLETWRLGAILALLPTILQLSVILFLSGLLVFLWNLDRMVADVMAVLLAITFFLVTAATFLPVVLRSCPFRSPLSEILAVVFWRVADYAKFLCKAVRAFIESGWTYSPDSRQWRFLSEQWHNYSKITSWVKADEGVMTRYNINCWAQGHLSMDVGAMVHLCCTTQSQSLWSAAIAAITAEDLANDWALYRNRAYKNEVWWPLLGHISRFTENDVVSEDKTIFEPLFAFRRLSLTMKRCWVNFLSHSKTIACHSQSTTVAVSHMICCLVASTESTTDGSCMQAFVEVLEAQFPNFKESQINYIKTFLFYAQSIRGCQLDALFNSISGLSFIVRIVSWPKHP
jgi:hypothetical protein